MLDSDDDDEALGLEADAESPVRKEARIDGRASSGISGGDGLLLGENDGEQKVAEEDWLQPKVANTYGRRSRSTRAGGHHTPTAASSRNNEVASISENGPFCAASSEVRAASTLQPVGGHDLYIDVSSKAARPIESNASDALSGLQSLQTPLAEDEPDLKAQSSDSENLPDVQDLLAGADDVESGISEGALSSGLSSPLSERSISPPAPAPTFRFPRRGLSSAEVESTEGLDTVEEQTETPEIPVEVAEAIHDGQRTFRARKAQQLHPYEYEKLQYQKQFRERGLRPVRVVGTERPAAGAHAGDSSDNEQNSWQRSQQARSSPARASSEIGEATNIFSRDDSDEELPDVVSIGPRTAVAVIQRGAKRQKLSHRHSDSHRPATAEHQTLDDFSVPPSPPPTSSESNQNRVAVSKPAVFRFPRGMTPKPRTQQATPNVSSDIRRARIDSDEDIPERARGSTVCRPRHAPIPIDSFTESSASESEHNDDPDVRRLLRERKRIRGVLPASWLKIDFKAQQRRGSQSPAKRGQQVVKSPEKTAPQKGVAQRIISRAPRSTNPPDAIPLSDDESDNDLSAYLSASKKRQSRLKFDRDHTSAAPTDLVDDSRMEVDYIDAMLAGGSRPRSRPTTSKKRQPRSTDAFATAQNQGSDIAEERRAARRATGASTGKTRGSRRRIRRQTIEKPATPHLSIIDAPMQTTSSQGSMPQFVKLAMRRARAQTDSGRHSPSRKHIRLATDRDTEDATSVLQAWRDGTVAPRQFPSDREQNRPSGMGQPNAAQAERDDRSRMPLAELSGNQQSRLPNALRTTEAKQRVGARRLNISNSKMRQSALQPITLDDGLADGTASSRNREDAAGHNPTESKSHTNSRPNVAHNYHRGAQVETLESEFDRTHRRAAFERRMHVLTENVVRGSKGRTPAAPIQLQRFLYDPDAVEPFILAQPSPRLASPQQGHEHSREVHLPERTLVRRPRKRVPQRLDAEARHYRQPSEPVPNVIDVHANQVPSPESSGDTPTLQGLGPFGTRYAVDFDTLPLPLGTYFHCSSFIGSGDFAASLNFAGRNLDVSTGRIRIHVDAHVLDFGIWNEEVAAGLAKLPAAISDALQTLTNETETQGSQDSPDVVLANVDYLLRSAVRYFTRCLAFSDPIDRRACAQSLQRLTEDIIEAATEPDLTESTRKDIQTRCLQYTAVLARQAVNICNHATVPSDVAKRSQQLLQRATGRLATHFLGHHVDDLRSFYEDSRRATKREAGIRDADSAICAITVLHRVLEGLENAQRSFWSTLNDAMDVHAELLASVPGLDQVWANVFTILPALEIDSHGTLRLGSRLEDAREDWSLCKALFERLCQLYQATSIQPGSTINNYMRATLTRCSRLQSRWGWSRCEPILYSISDFFAQRGLGQLHKEQSHGSPSFLHQLDQQPSLEVHADDRSFHIFLKMLASGLRDMRDRGIYLDKKIGGIAWRFIPNHGRTHRKDADVRQEDLDALRNHHDLLSTIYYASPPNNRLRVDLIQNLVDHTASHREACRLNVRAWRNLAVFQASTGEVVERLQPFNDWFQELLASNIMQFRLARTEVEQDAASAVAGGKSAVSQDMMESIIAANQRQIAATITDALAAVKHAIKSAKSLNGVVFLLSGTTFGHVFDLFDPTVRKVFGVFNECLEIVQAVIQAQKQLQSGNGTQVGSDNSQDYGDSSALQELASTQLPMPVSESDILEIVHTPVVGFLSSVFGADGMPDDVLLNKVIDVWIELASLFVSRGSKTWQSYITGYGSEAWSQLRDTEQRRKYTPYFLAKVGESHDVDLAETGILTFWLKSLVEREATLKFQHTLTSALFNREHGGPLLDNLPFARPRNGPFAISLHELRQCRLGLISSVLSNMHQHFDQTMSHRAAKLPELRKTYADMLRQTMHAMKTNYQDVQASSSAHAADSRAQGDYVGFVQQVVSFLQQYTTDICPIDRFFTDSFAFPLPATDPTYVVGRLRGYVPKLSESRRRKELAVFVQTVSERAAVDGQQGYLANQLTAAMIGVLERGDPRAPSLRQVLMTAIFPAYIENALSNACSWILALPVLQACGRVVPDLLYHVRIDDPDSVKAAFESIVLPVRCMAQVVETALASPGQLMFPHVLVTLRMTFDTVQRSLTAMQHIGSVRGDDYLARASSHFSSLAAGICKTLSGNEDFGLAETFLNDPVVQPHWPDTRHFARKQFQDNMNGWHARDGQYFMRRGTGSVEVATRMEDAAEEKGQLLEALRRYRESYEAVFEGRGRERGVSMMKDVMV